MPKADKNTWGNLAPKPEKAKKKSVSPGEIADRSNAFSTYLPKETQKQLKLFAVTSDRPIHSIVYDAITEYLDKNAG